jgi:tRNA pseudouridine55 synthase
MLDITYNGFGVAMDFILNLKKPLGISSHDVVNQVRTILKTRKVGHAGTLDVEASGVLIVGVGEGTKLLNHLQNHTKTYAFDICFGILTDTLDHTGIITEVDQCTLPSTLNLSSFIGDYFQSPPAYSAVKIKGKKLYEYARKNQPIPEVKQRHLKISKFVQITPLKKVGETYHASFEVTASSGLYVRQLAFDLAKSLGTVAHTTRIHRREVGTFKFEDATELSELKLSTGISLSNAIPEIKKVHANDIQLSYVKVGRTLEINETASLIQIVDAENRLYGLYEKTEEDYKALRIFKGV